MKAGRKPAGTSAALAQYLDNIKQIEIHKRLAIPNFSYCGLAAVDLLIGATQLCEDDTENKIFPGRFPYGGGHVIEDVDFLAAEGRKRAAGHFGEQDDGDPDEHGNHLQDPAPDVHQHARSLPASDPETC